MNILSQFFINNNFKNINDFFEETKIKYYKNNYIYGFIPAELVCILYKEKEISLTDSLKFFNLFQQINKREASLYFDYFISNCDFQKENLKNIELILQFYENKISPFLVNSFLYKQNYSKLTLEQKKNIFEHITDLNFKIIISENLQNFYYKEDPFLLNQIEDIFCFLDSKKIIIDNNLYLEFNKIKSNYEKKIITNNLFEFGTNSNKLKNKI